jgi:DNA recombination protein RmuC
MDNLSVAAIAGSAGAGLGALVVWLWLRNQATLAAERSRADARVELATAGERLVAAEQDLGELRRALEALKLQAEGWREALDAVRDERAQLGERAARIPGLEAELAGLRSELAASRQEGLRLSTELAESAAQLAGERQQAEEKLRVLQEARVALADQFTNLANQILEEKSKRFTEQNQVNLGQLLDPLRNRLVEFQARVEDVYVKESKDRSALAEQVRQLMALNQSLSQDARNLTDALKGSSKAQGNWGELILERVLESSGLRKGEEYVIQESHTREDGSRAQPDVIIHLPEARHLVVDAKVSLTAYEAFVSAEDDAQRQGALRRHLDSIRGHVRGLSERNYPELYSLNSLDFVLMFVPVEPAFMLAVTQDRELFMDAWQRNVLLVSPSTLLFVLRTVEHLWRQEAQSRNAQEIARRGAELYDRLVAFVADLEKLGERLKQAQDSYHEARDKLARNKGNVIRQAELLKQLGVKPSKNLPAGLVEGSGSEPGGS